MRVFLTAAFHVLQSLNELFVAYCNYGTRVNTTELDGARFVKLFKDAGLVGNGLIATDLDIIYSKVNSQCKDDQEALQ